MSVVLEGIPSLDPGDPIPVQPVDVTTAGLDPECGINGHEGNGSTLASQGAPEETRGA
jgi:hypothetical protein